MLLGQLVLLLKLTREITYLDTTDEYTVYLVTHHQRPRLLVILLHQALPLYLLLQVPIL